MSTTVLKENRYIYCMIGKKTDKPRLRESHKSSRTEAVTFDAEYIDVQFLFCIKYNPFNM